MTELFYSKLWTFILDADKQKLCTLLQKKKVVIQGFRLTKSLSASMIAPTLVKREKAFFDILHNNFMREFKDKQDAIASFNKGNSLFCISYLSKKDELDEDTILSLMDTDTPSSKSEKSKTPSRDKKKSDEFRQKYLASQKEAKDLRDEIKELEAVIKDLRLQISEKEQLIQRKNDDLSSLENLFNEYKKQAERTEASLKKQIEELRRKLADVSKTRKQNDPKKLVISPPGKTFLGVDTLYTTDSIDKIKKEITSHKEIFYVKNTLPFGIKRVLEKTIQDETRVSVCATYQELINKIKE